VTYNITMLNKDWFIRFMRMAVSARETCACKSLHRATH